MREARKLFHACAAAACGSRLRQLCARRYEHLNGEIPSIVPIVTHADGTPEVNVQVIMDAQLLTSHLDGRALPVDPGLHEFKFQVGAAAPIKKTLMIAQGDHDRAISITVEDAKRAPEKPALPAKPPIDPESAAEPMALAAAADAPQSRSLLLPWLLTGTGLAGIGGYALLVNWGRKDDSRLAKCTPQCEPSSIRHVRNLYLAADISLGVAVAALGTATWLFFSSAGKSDEHPRETAKLNLNVAPTPRGGFASLSGAF